MDATALALPAAIGQLLCPTLFHGLARGPAYDGARAADALDRYGWGGLIVFHDARDAMAARLAPLRAQARIPLLVAADLEQGAGQHLHGAAVFPPAMAFGAAGDPAWTEALGAITAREALAAGVDWVLAPVADVTNNPANPIINLRSFGGDPAAVGAHVAAFVRGCQGSGALACAKHFPGHGDTATDSHTRLGTVAAARARLDAVELAPFRAAIAAGVATVMTAHLAVPALDAADRPATLSRRIMTDLLRGELGFEGLVVTDAMGMGGVAGDLDPREAAVAAVAAGCDMVLMPPDPAGTHAALVAAVAAGRLAEARVYEAAGRVLAAKARVGAGRAPDGQNAAALARSVAAGAITLARGPAGHQVPAGALAIALDDGAERDRLDAWRAAVRAHGLVEGPIMDVTSDEAAWADLLARAGAAPGVLVGVFSPIRLHKDRSLLPAALLDPLRALAARRPTTLASFSSPFLVAQVPEATAWVVAFGSRPVQIAAALAAMCAGAGYPGRLPVALPDRLAAAPGGTTAPPDDRPPAFA